MRTSSGLGAADMETNMSPEEQLITKLLKTYHFKRTAKSRPIYQQGPSMRKELLNDRLVAQMLAPKMVVEDLSKHKIIKVKAMGITPVPGEVSSVADQLTHIVDSAPPAQDEPEPDGHADIIQRLVELLKESGDKLNEKILKDQELLGQLQNGFSYPLFENLASAFIGKVVPTNKQGEEEQKRKIAWTFEMTSRLSALDLQPMNRAMGFGAHYVHQHFAPWVQQQGGWEKVFNSDEGDEVQ